VRFGTGRGGVALQKILTSFPDVLMNITAIAADVFAVLTQILPIVAPVTAIAAHTAPVLPQLMTISAGVGRLLRAYGGDGD
jgi:hypothetical protein